jgi:hypothetical protein
MRQTLENMKMEVNSIPEELWRYAERDELDDDAMEIEWTNPATPPDFVAKIQRVLDEGRLVVDRAGTPAPNPHSKSGSRAATRTMRQRNSLFAAFPVRSTMRAIPIVQLVVGDSPLVSNCSSGVHPLFGEIHRPFDYEGELYTGGGQRHPSSLARNPQKVTIWSHLHSRSFIIG